METIGFDDFKKLDIRIGKINSAERIKETDKLIKFIFDFGSEQRQIIAGMAEFFEDLNFLVGKQMPVLLNIKPAVFCGYKSEGMILAADVDHAPVLLHPQKEIPNGSKIK